MHGNKIVLVAGLGNPGEKYARTRHNAGFAVVDALAERHGVSYWKSEAGCQVAEITLPAAQAAASGAASGEKRHVLLAKPQDFMNTSGGPLSKLARAHHLQPAQMLVIHDEVDLAEGQLNFKEGGGLNSHNGLRSIADKLQTRDFMRLQFGIGRPPGNRPDSSRSGGAAPPQLAITALRPVPSPRVATARPCVASPPNFSPSAASRQNILRNIYAHS